MRVVTIHSGNENSHDTFYHVTMADIGPAYYTAKKLPVLTLSYWNENFSDKELSFHLLLSGIRKTMEVTGQPTGAPFHLEYLIFAILLIASFVLTCKYFRIENIYLYTLLLVGISPFFTTRLLVLRPHLLAISLVLLSCVLFDKVDRWKNVWIPLLLGFVMAWSYSNPHFILLSAVTFAFVKFGKNWKLALLIPVMAVIGIILGFTLHPQFPNTFINWKIQCVDVMLISLNRSSPVRLGYELCPGNFNFFVEHFMLFVLLIINSAMLCFYLKNKKFVNADKAVIAMYFMGLISYLGIFLAVRAVEYASPFALLTIGMLVREYNKEEVLSLSEKTKKIIFVSSIALVMIITGWAGNNYYIRAKNHDVKPPMHFAQWLVDRKIPPGTVIGNINWSDFPTLFYAAPGYRYLAGIDPMFAYFKAPDKVSQIELFRTGRKYLSPEELYNAAGTRFIFVSYLNDRLAVDMFKRGFVAVYQGRDGNLFDLKLSLDNMKKTNTDKK